MLDSDSWCIYLPKGMMVLDFSLSNYSTSKIATWFPNCSSMGDSMGADHAACHDTKLLLILWRSIIYIFEFHLKPLLFFKGVPHKFLLLYYFPSNYLIKLCFAAVRIKTCARADVGTPRLPLWSVLSSANQHWQVKFLLLPSPTVLS